MLKLTSPEGNAVYIAVQHVQRIVVPIQGYKPSTKALIHLTSGTQEVQETVEEVAESLVRAMNLEPTRKSYP